MRRAAKILGWTLGALIVVPAFVIGLAYLVANTDSGRRMIEQAAARFSAGRILISGISGHFPDDLQLTRLEVGDANGPWIIAEDVALQWSPLQLSRKHVEVQLLRAGRVQLLRPPASQGNRNWFEQGLPGRVDVDRIEANRFDIAAPIAGAAVSVKLDGGAHIASLHHAEVGLNIARIDAPGTYHLAARVADSRLSGEVVVDEPEHGLISGLANLPDLGALSLRLSMEGPRDAEVTTLALAAGPLHADGHGRLDLNSRTIDVDVTATGPAMAPGPRLSWKGLSLKAHVHGPLDAPDANGELRIDELTAGDAHLRSVRAEVQGNRGAVAFHAVLDRLRIPGPKPGLFESAPIELRADVRLDEPARPVTFAVAHPLLSLQGRADTGAELAASVSVMVPSLAPLATVAGIDLRGRTSFDVQLARRGQATAVEITGLVGVTGGTGPAAALIGNAAKIAVLATLQGDQVTVKQAQLDGRTARFSADGSAKRDTLDFDWKIAVSDLSALTPEVSGRIEARGRVRGAPANLDLTADASGEMATHGFPSGPVTASVALSGLPSSTSGKIDANATLDGSPLQLVFAFQLARDGSLRGKIDRADWKSAHAEGELRLPKGARWPQGQLSARIGELNDLQPWIGQAVHGELTATVDTLPNGDRLQSKVDVDARHAGIPGTEIDRVRVTGTVDDATNRPTLALQVTADGIASRGITGSLRLEANGPRDALKLKLTSALHHATEGDVPLDATATLDAGRSELALTTLTARYRGQTVQLLAPAHISFGNGLAVDRLRVGMQQAVLEVDGRISPTLDLTASLRNATPALAKTIAPDVQADGTLSLDARLGGTLEEPRGSVKFAANGLRMRTGSARSLPPASVTGNADLDGRSARIDLKVSAGNKAHLDAFGTVPLSSAASIDVHTRGTVDATVANPMLEVNGRRVKGTVTVDLALSGTWEAPQAAGSLRIADGEIQDYSLGAQLTSLDAVLQAEGDTVRIAKFTAHAGSGTVSASGTVGVFASEHPVNVQITARNAKPLSTDLLTAEMDADLTLRGAAATRLDVAGSITVHRADITIPKALPPTVAVLDVRRSGQKTPEASAPAVIGLDLAVSAPRSVYVRGRGVDAETGGDLHVYGTAASPQISGAFDMRRGSFDLGGATLTFTSGKVSFSGTGLSQKIDPTLDFLAQSTSGDITATLTITGYADAPRIALSSTPELPQDEILARLLFGVSAKQLSPLQLAQIAAAVATITGVTGGSNPLAAIQKSLGLDRLSTGSTATGGTTIEAGRYVADRVYVGAKQNTQGGTQAQVQVDLTKNLKLQATLGMGGTVPVQGATPENDPGSSIGLSYQFEY